MLGGSIAPGALAPDQPSAPPSAPFDAMRRMALSMGLVMVFLRFSMLHQLQAHTMGFNLRLLYIFGIPAILGVLVAGGIQRSFRSRPTIYWLLFVLWLFPATLFSSWKIASATLLLAYLRTNVPMLFIMAGLVVTWEECRTLIRVIAWAGLVSLVSARIFANDAWARLTPDFGSITDPNDLAAHILLIASFLLWIVLASKRALFRVMALAGLAFALYLVLSTGSRGGFLGLAVGVALYWILGTARRRIALLLLLPLALVGFLSVVPASSLERLTAFSDPDHLGAYESQESRKRLFWRAVRYSIYHPVVGVGPGQFGNYGGMQDRLEGLRGSWHNTHNTFLQVSSECGIPAFFFYVAAVGSSFGLLIQTYRRAGNRPEFAEIRTTAACVLIGFGSFCVAITFLSFAYFFYLPAMSGLAISLWHAARERFEAGQSAPLHALPPPHAASAPRPARARRLPG